MYFGASTVILKFRLEKGRRILFLSIMQEAAKIQSEGNHGMDQKAAVNFDAFHTEGDWMWPELSVEEMIPSFGSN